MSDEQYSEMSGTLARDSGVSQVTIANYADLGFLDYVRSSTGVRLFKPGQAGKVRGLVASRRGKRVAPNLATA